MKASRGHPLPFWEQTKWDGSCLLWTGAQNRYGYGKVTHESRTCVAHRLAYSFYYVCELARGQIVMHLCNTPLCCNPLHLRLGTIQENNAQAKAQGRLRSGREHPRTLAKLNWKLVRKIRSLAGRMTQTEIANQFGITQSNVSYISGGKTWRE